MSEGAIVALIVGVPLAVIIPLALLARRREAARERAARNDSSVVLRVHRPIGNGGKLMKGGALLGGAFALAMALAHDQMGTPKGWVAIVIFAGFGAMLGAAFSNFPVRAGHLSLDRSTQLLAWKEGARSVAIELSRPFEIHESHVLPSKFHPYVRSCVGVSQGDTVIGFWYANKLGEKPVGEPVGAPPFWLMADGRGRAIADHLRERHKATGSCS